VIAIGSFADELIVIEQEDQCRRNFHIPSARRDPGPLAALRSLQTTLYDDCMVRIIALATLLSDRGANDHLAVLSPLSCDNPSSQVLISCMTV
jgi:hypothetical protein